MSPDKPKPEVSRRAFLKAAAAGGAIAAVPLKGDAAQDAPTTYGPGKVAITLHINGKDVPITVEPRATLLDVLRNQLNLTGTKEVCDRGACGACTVMFEGKPVVSCLVLALDAVGHQITTIEGLAKGETLEPLQQKFVEKEGLQCGFCIPGFIMSIRALLNEKPKATLEQIKEGCSGNVCRCAAYPGMFAAALAVVRGEKPEPPVHHLAGDDLKKVLEERGVPRLDGPEKVRGSAKYTYDVKLPGMLTAKIAHCPFAVASLEGFPTEGEARNIPGVRFVEIFRAPRYKIGEPAAVVVGEDAASAEEGLAALKIAWKPVPPTLDAAKVYRAGRLTAIGDNGAADRAVASAHAHVEATFHLHMVQHAPLEPHGVVAHPQGRSATIYESSQHISGSHELYARTSKLGQAAVQVIAEHVGGGFGCKISPWEFGPRALEVARKAGVPVQTMQSRAGELLWGGGRCVNYVNVKLACDREGKLVAERRRLLHHPHQRWGRRLLSPLAPYWYDVPVSAAEIIETELDGTGPTPALRAPHDPEQQIIMESMVEDLAERIGADPLEFRLKNSKHAERMKRWFEEGKPRIGWDRRRRAGSDQGPRPHGFGVGCGEFAGARGCHFIEVEVDRGTGLVKVVKVVKVVAIMEGGFINRRAVINQLVGGTIMALSWWMTEERILDGATGAMLNPNFEFYKILGPQDIPEIDPVLIGAQGKPSGVGEAPVVPVGGALANAITNALGIRITETPFTPRRVLTALGKG